MILYYTLNLNNISIIHKRRQMSSQGRRTRIHHIDDFQRLIEKYPDSQSFEKTIKSLKSSFPTYRKVYGEGNCFYRTFAFLYLVNTNFNSYEQVFPRVRFICRGIPNIQSNQAFQEKLRGFWVDHLSKISHLRDKNKEDAIMQIFNQVEEFDEVMIGYFRSKNYQIMVQKRQQFELYSIDFEYDYLLNQVSTFYSFSQLVEIHALPQAFNLNIVIINLNQNQDGVDIITAGKEPDYPTNYYLLRTVNPEHFQVVYPVLDSRQTKGSKINQWLFQLKTVANMQSKSYTTRNQPYTGNKNLNTAYERNARTYEDKKIIEKPRKQGKKSVKTSDNQKFKQIGNKEDKTQGGFNGRVSKSKEIVLGEENMALKVLRQISIITASGTILYLIYEFFGH